MLRRNTLLTIICCLGALFTVACNSDYEKEDMPQPKMDLVRKHLGNSFIDKVVESDYSLLIKVTPKLPSKYKIENERVTISDQDAKDLKNILLNNDSYMFDLTKSCLFIPEYAIDFQGETNVTILLSPTCKQIEVIDEQSSSVRADIDPAFDSIMSILSKYQEKL
ncbi:MAG: hypothetical protein VX777_10000 [Chlamydiota bacterium]|nr:hypothetical protein [Chlamydiota bacterium]